MAWLVNLRQLYQKFQLLPAGGILPSSTEIQPNFCVNLATAHYGAFVMLSRRHFFACLLAVSFSFLSWLNFVPPALALGGKLPALNASAPAFTLPTHTGDGQVSLTDYSGKWVVLYFYPKDFTSGCTIEARRFQQDISEYNQRNAQIVGISADSIDTHAKFCDSEGIKFPLLADTNGAVSKSYGSWIGVFSMRHTFLISPEGELKYIFTGVNPSTHSAEVLAKLDEIKQA